MNNYRIKKEINIGLLGLDFESGNLGCAALGYSFVKLIVEAIKDAEIIVNFLVFEPIDTEKVKELFNDEKVTFTKFVFNGNRTRKQRKTQIDLFRQCNIVFDFTAGDSFSDIYGIKRFISRTLIKQNVIKSGTPLILGNQTYGPFKNLMVRAWANWIIKNSYESISRDKFSTEYIVNKCHIKPFESIDVAFALPFKKSRLSSEKVKIGLNPSGLLWSGGYTRDNQFNLSVNYSEFSREIIRKYYSNPEYEIHLIPHVLSRNLTYSDNDMAACINIQKEFPNIKVSPYFTSPLEAKSYISNMDVFIGARMHATIAAYSSGVPTIPFAYSRKFTGLYNSLNYPYVIDGMNSTTEEAVATVCEYIEKREQLRLAISKEKDIVNQRIGELKRHYRMLIIGEDVQ